MNKKTKDSIQEIINDILEIRKEKFDQDILNKEELHFYKEILPNADEEQFDNSKFYEEIGITEEDINQANEMTRPNEETLNKIAEQQHYNARNTYSDVWSKYVFEFDKPLVKLNKLLDTSNQIDTVLEIEKQMAKIQAKKTITVKEFTEIYSFSADWQKNRRSRIKNRLPSQQTISGGKITYDKSEIEIWFSNENITY